MRRTLLQSHSSYLHRNKLREKARQEKLAVYKETGVWPVSKSQSVHAKKTESWSENKAQKARKKEKKQLKLVVKEKRKKAAVDEDEWNELARDARLLKKFKKRKVRASFSYLATHTHTSPVG